MGRGSQELNELIELIGRLPPTQIAEAERALRDARHGAEATIEIDLAAAGRTCPCCGGTHKVRHGQTRTGAQRWRCRDCGRTWSGLTGTPVRGIHRPDLFLRALRDMMGDTPRSCRKLASVLGISRHTVWRWRMIVIQALPAEQAHRLAGIVETDEAPQRESRKGSREWVRHAADPKRHPPPPRMPWREYTKRTAVVTTPPGGWLHWHRKLLAATDRSGHRAFEAIADVSQPTISAALLPSRHRSAIGPSDDGDAPDAVLCTDGLATYGKIAKDERIPHFVLVKGRRGKNTPKTHHINTVNALIARFRAFLAPFCGPASKNLTAYGRWHAARDNADRDYHSIFKLLLSSSGPANTVC